MECLEYGLIGIVQYGGGTLIECGADKTGGRCHISGESEHAAAATERTHFKPADSAVSAAAAA